MAENVQVFGVDIRNKVRKDFPFVPGAWVEFWDDAIMADLLNAQENEESLTTRESLSLIVSQIADWNFADAEGNKVEVTVDSLLRLGTKGAAWISETATEVVTKAVGAADTQKKELPAS